MLGPSTWGSIVGKKWLGCGHTKLCWCSTPVHAYSSDKSGERWQALSAFSGAFLVKAATCFIE